MWNRFRWLFWLSGLILIGDFFVLMIFADVLKSTHLFITSQTVFNPLAWLNLIVGVLLIALLVWELVRSKK